MLDARSGKITLKQLKEAAHKDKPFAMLTAYDYQMAAQAAQAGVPVLLVGDSMGSVLLGQETTRDVPLDLMVVLAEAVRRGAENAYLVGDIPFVAMEGGRDSVLEAARRFRDYARCDAVKLETQPEDAEIVAALVAEGFEVIAHLGLRPQMATSRDQLRAQARDAEAVRELVEDCQAMVAAGAQMLLLEAIPNEAAEAVVAGTKVPVIGCGAGTACHGHVVVTQDMLGVGAGKPPRFVPVLASVGADSVAAMKDFMQQISDGTYPGPEHTYGMRKTAAKS